MPRPIHFELPADDLRRAKRFYEVLFGWTFPTWGGGDYMAVSTGDSGRGINGAIAKRTTPGQATVNTIEVASVDRASANVVRLGGNIVSPKIPIKGVGWLVYAVDTEGNRFGMLERDPDAR